MAAAVEEMTVSIDHISKNASDANTISNEAGALSADGGRIVGTVVDEIRLIADAVNSSANIIDELGRQSDAISAIVNNDQRKLPTRPTCSRSTRRSKWRARRVRARFCGGCRRGEKAGGADDQVDAGDFVDDRRHPERRRMPWPRCATVSTGSTRA